MMLATSRMRPIGNLAACAPLAKELNIAAVILLNAHYSSAWRLTLAASEVHARIAASTPPAPSLWNLILLLFCMIYTSYLLMPCSRASSPIGSMPSLLTQNAKYSMRSRAYTLPSSKQSSTPSGRASSAHHGRISGPFDQGLVCGVHSALACFIRSAMVFQGCVYLRGMKIINLSLSLSENSSDRVFNYIMIFNCIFSFTVLGRDAKSADAPLNLQRRRRRRSKVR